MAHTINASIKGRGGELIWLLSHSMFLCVNHVFILGALEKTPKQPFVPNAITMSSLKGLFRFKILIPHVPCAKENYPNAVYATAQDIYKTKTNIQSSASQWLDVCVFMPKSTKTATPQLEGIAVFVDNSHYTSIIMGKIIGRRRVFS